MPLLVPMNLYDNIDSNLGSMFIGVILSAVLLGLCLIQAFYYYIRYPNDPWYYRSLVTVIALFDTIHLAMIAHSLYFYLITNYNRPDQLQYVVWSIVIEALFTGVTGALVQCFYLTRVWKMSNKSYILTGIILLFVLGDASCGTVWVILAIQVKTYEQLLAISPITITINALSTAADILIAGSLCILLHKARTGFKRSDTMINKLTIFVVNTGVLTSCCAIASLVCLIVSPDTLLYASFYFCIGRLYTNAFLATLNARKDIGGTTNDGSHMMVSMPSTMLNTATIVKSQKSSQGIAIRIDRTTTKDQSLGYSQVHADRNPGTGKGFEEEDEYILDEPASPQQQKQPLDSSYSV